MTRFDLTDFEWLSCERGLPQAIRSGDGAPFASPNALFNRSKLSVWWLRPSIAIGRIKPGDPQQNGRRERMHLTLKKRRPAPRFERPSATSPLRRLRARVQRRKTARGARREASHRGLRTFATALQRPGIKEADGGCHPCFRYTPLPISRVRTNSFLAEGTGFEPSTPTFARLCTAFPLTLSVFRVSPKACFIAYFVSSGYPSFSRVSIVSGPQLDPRSSTREDGPNGQAQ
jgi:hypothetical protein